MNEMQVPIAVMACLVIFIAGTFSSDGAESTNEMGSRLAKISEALREGAVGKIEIIQIPARVLTRARISPEMLETQFHNKVIIRDFTETKYRQNITDSFKSISAVPKDRAADLRWGVIFFTRDGLRMGAVYFDKSGDSGSVDELPASFKGNFFSWLDSTFGSCLQ